MDPSLEELDGDRGLFPLYETSRGEENWQLSKWVMYLKINRKHTVCKIARPVSMGRSYKELCLNCIQILAQESFNKEFKGLFVTYY